MPSFIIRRILQLLSCAAATSLSRTAAVGISFTNRTENLIIRNPVTGL
jgi:hypothetical protein